MRVPFYLRATIKNLRRSTQAWGSGEFVQRLLAGQRRGRGMILIIDPDS